MKLSLEYLLECFEEPYFPRTIQAKTGAQIMVNSIEEILLHFERVGFVDCRISLFGQNEIKQIRPNAIFIDLDDITQLDFVKHRIFNTLGGRPLIIFTGRGYAVIQPILIESMVGLTHSGYDGEFISKTFLSFATRFLTNNKADESNHPGLKNTLIRVPFTINSKSGKDVELFEPWDHKRVSITIMPFKSHFKTIINEQRRIENSFVIKPSNYSWIENILSGPPLYKSNRMLGLVIARYLMNVKRISKQEAIKIINKWDPGYQTSRINYELGYALKTGKLPVGLKQFILKNEDYAKELQKFPDLSKHNPLVKNIPILLVEYREGQSKFIDLDNVTHSQPIEGLDCYVCGDSVVFSKGKLFNGSIVNYCSGCWICVCDVPLNKEVLSCHA